MAIGLDNCCGCGGNSCSHRGLMAVTPFSGAVPLPDWQLGTFTGTTAGSMYVDFGVAPIGPIEGTVGSVMGFTTLGLDTREQTRYLQIVYRLEYTRIEWDDVNLEYVSRGQYWVEETIKIDSRVNKIWSIEVETSEEGVVYSATMAEDGTLSESGDLWGVSDYAYPPVIWPGEYTGDASATRTAVLGKTVSTWTYSGTWDPTGVAIPMTEVRTTTASVAYTVDNCISNAAALLTDVVDWALTNQSFEVFDYWTATSATKTFALGQYWYRRYAADWPIRKQFCDTPFTSISPPYSGGAQADVLGGFDVWRWAILQENLYRDGGFEDWASDRIGVTKMVHAVTGFEGCLIGREAEVFFPSTAASPDTGGETAYTAVEDCFRVVVAGVPAKYVYGPDDVMFQYGSAKLQQDPPCSPDTENESEWPACCDVGTRPVTADSSRGADAGFIRADQG